MLCQMSTIVFEDDKMGGVYALYNPCYRCCSHTDAFVQKEVTPLLTCWCSLFTNIMP